MTKVSQMHFVYVNQTQKMHNDLAKKKLIYKRASQFNVLNCYLFSISTDMSSQIVLITKLNFEILNRL